MKRKNNPWLLTQTLILFLGIAIAVLFQKVLISNSNRLFFLIVPFVAFGVNILAYKVSRVKDNSANFSMALSGLFAVKFFSYIILSVIFFLIEKENKQRLYFIVFLFVIYLINTMSLLFFYIKKQKKHI